MNSKTNNIFIPVPTNIILIPKDYAIHYKIIIQTTNTYPSI